MAIDISALSTDPTSTSPTDATPGNDRARRSDRRIPAARETLATLTEAETEPTGFEPHDTIPAPPWLDGLEEQSP